MYAPRPFNDEVLARLERGLRLAPPRVQLLYVLMRDTGMRVSEALALRRGDVDLAPGNAQLRVNLGKGRHGRTVPILSRRLSTMLRKAVRRIEDPHSYVFPGRAILGRPARPWTRQGAGIAWRAWLKQLGLSRQQQHQLRHTFGTELGRRPGMDPFSLMNVMGWQKLETAVRYCAPENVRRIVGDLGR